MYDVLVSLSWRFRPNTMRMSAGSIRRVRSYHLLPGLGLGVFGEFAEDHDAPVYAVPVERSGVVGRGDLAAGSKEVLSTEMATAYRSVSGDDVADQRTVRGQHAHLLSMPSRVRG